MDENYLVFLCGLPNQEMLMMYIIYKISPEYFNLLPHSLYKKSQGHSLNIGVDIFTQTPLIASFHKLHRNVAGIVRDCLIRGWTGKFSDLVNINIASFTGLSRPTGQRQTS